MLDLMRRLKNTKPPRITETETHQSSSPITQIQLALPELLRQQRESPSLILHPSLLEATITTVAENQQRLPPPPGYISSSSSLLSSSSTTYATTPNFPTPTEPQPRPEPSSVPENPQPPNPIIPTKTQTRQLPQPNNKPQHPEPEPQPKHHEPVAPPAPPIPLPPPRMTTRSQNNISKPNQKYSLTTATKSKLSPKPTTMNQAMHDPNWRYAMSDEFDSQVGNHTWDLVPYSPEMNIIGCRWVFEVKTLSNGKLDRYKARLMEKGFHQKWGLDFLETFSSVIKSTMIHLVVGVAVGKSWPVKQVDVNTAFYKAP